MTGTKRIGTAASGKPMTERQGAKLVDALQELEGELHLVKRVLKELLLHIKDADLEIIEQLLNTLKGSIHD